MIFCEKQYILVGGEGVGWAPSTTRLRTSSDEFEEGVIVYWQASSQTPFW